MSVIQTIRNRYGKIAGAVIAIALIGFIISDARNGSFGSFFGGHDSSIMKVNGTKIDPKDYQTALKEVELIYAKGRTLDDATRAQMDEQVIQSMVEETAIGEQCDKLGIQTSDEEKKQLIYGPNIAKEIYNFEINGQHIFMNPETGSFDPGRVKEFEKELQTNPDRIDPDGKVREQWEAIKDYVLRTNRIDKYRALLLGSFYEPIYIAKRSFAAQNEKASIKYVKIPFTSVPDNEVKVTDEDIKGYMQQHPGFFQADQPTRTVEYVSFDIIPSSADTARILDGLKEIKDDFTTAKDNKTFVNNKSDDVNSYSEEYVNKKMFTSHFADTIMSQQVNSIFGPVYENGTYKLVKVTGKKDLPDSVKCRYILVVTKNKSADIRTDTVAKQRLDSAIAAIKGGATFDSVVSKYSDDKSKDNGENTFSLQQKPGLPKDLADFIFDGKTGESKVIKENNPNFSGYFYVQILEQKEIEPAVQLAIISKNLTPSDSTVNAIYAKANEFAGKNATGPEFDAAIKAQNLNRRVSDPIKMNSFTITGLGASRDVIKWAFDHKIEDVSQVFQLGDQRYLIAKVASIQDKGVMTITPYLRQQLTPRVMEQLKGDKIASRYKGATSLDAISKTANSPIQESDSVLLGASYITGLGYEPKVVGYSFYQGLQANTLSPAIKGQSGIYFITVLNKATPSIDMNNPNLIQMLSSQRMMQEMQERNAMAQLFMQTIVKKADVQYNYNNF